MRGSRVQAAFFPSQFIGAAALALLTAQATAGQHQMPFSLKSFGNFQDMVRHAKTDGVVNLKAAVSLPHVYAVGALAHGVGEITVLDGKAWLNYGADGMDKAKHVISDDEQAVLLVTAQVKEWRSVRLVEDLNATELHQFILGQARRRGIDTAKPFPFLVEGTFLDLDWHVIAGRAPSTGNHKPSAAKKGSHAGGNDIGHRMGGALYKKLKEHRAKATGTVVGFYSAAMQGVYTHMGESWHLHIVFDSNGKAGHVDGLSVAHGAVLKLPVYNPI